MNAVLPMNHSTSAYAYRGPIRRPADPAFSVARGALAGLVEAAARRWAALAAIAAPARGLLRRFWAWYQHHYLINLVVTTGLFLLQLFHLYWLFTDVVLRRLFGHSFFVVPQRGMLIYVVVDYLEIPALLSATVLYLYQLRRGFGIQPLFYLLLLNTQWVHLLWITDEVVVDTLTGQSLLVWNAVVAWVAILIDYLEVPVIVDTLRKVCAERRAIVRRIRDSLARPRLGRTQPAQPAAVA